MAEMEDKFTTFSSEEAISIVTTSADLPTRPCTSLVETDQETKPVASTLETLPEANSLPPASDAIWGLNPRDRLLLLVLGTVCLALSVGLSRIYRDDLQQLDAGLPLYDALYRWARDGHEEGHDWPQGRRE